MRIDSIQLTEGSNISNLTVASGTSFPASPNSAELFFRTDSNITIRGMYVYINGSWDRLASSDALTAPSGTSFPSAATAGDLFYLNSNDSTEGLYAYDGASWNVASGSKPVAVASANGLSGSVDNSSGTITITLTTSVTGILKGNGTAISAAVAGDFPTLNQNTTGSAARLTTARAISTIGDVSWTTSFDGSAAASADATLATVNSSPQTDSFRKVTVNGKGLVTATSAVVKSDITALVGINDILPSQTGLANKFLKTDGTNTSWADPSGIPAGSTLQVQYNNAGAFGASANLTFDPTIGLTTTGIFTSQRFGTVGALDLRSATGTLGTPTAISGSTAVGVITFAGYNGSAYDTIASITARTNGTLAGTGAPGFLVLSTTGTGSSVPTQRLKIDSEGNVIVGGVSALVTNATDGFLYVPTTAGTPSGTPTAYTGAAATVINSSTNALYFYSNGAWRSTNAAGSLTGTTLASNVTASSLTSVGTLTSLGVTGSVTAGSFSGSGSGLTNIPNSALSNSSISVVGSTGLNVSGSPVALGGTVTLTNSGVTSIVAGTNVTISGATGAVTINASSPNVGVTDDTTTNATVYPTWVTATTGNLPIKVSSTKTTLNPSTGLFTSSAFSTPGNLSFSGTSQRILGDFSTTTYINRLAFQSNVTNGNTSITALPNGTSTNSGISVFNNSDPTNAAFTQITASATASNLIAGITGTGTYLPLQFVTSNAPRLSIDTAGNVGIGGAGAQPGNLAVDFLVSKDAATQSITQTYTSSAAGATAVVAIQRTRGTYASPSPVQATDYLGQLIFSGGTTSTSGSPGFINTASITCQAAENFSPTNGGTALVFMTTPIGSVTRTERMRVNNAGNVFIGTAALATSATDGFLQITSMPGQPSTAPSAGNTGVFPMVFDSTNNALMFYNNISNSWKNVATAATAAAGLLTGTTLASNVVSSSLTSVGTLSNLVVTGTTTSGAFRANQGIPNAADSSTNGYAFGADGDTGMFGPGSTSAAGVVAMYSNNAETARFISTGISTGLNLAFTGASSRITGDFTNASLANRTLFQSSTTNGATIVGAITNGTSTDGALCAFNSSNPANSSAITMYANAADVRLTSDKNGTGSYLPLAFHTGGTQRLVIDASGNFGFNTSTVTDSAVYIAQVGNSFGMSVAAATSGGNSGKAISRLVNAAYTVERLRLEGTSDTVARLGVPGTLSIGDVVGTNTYATFGSGTLVLQSTGTAVTNMISQNSGQLAGFRNRIINGQMLVDNRNAGAAITPTTTQYTTDRWGFYPSVASKLTFQQVGDAPAGFINSMKVTVAAQYTPAATDFFHFSQVIEAYNCIDFQYGSAGAQTATLSFWVKASVAGTYSGALRGATTTQAYPFNFTVTTGWTKIVLTFVGPTTGTWGTYSAAGFSVTIDLGSGANFNGTAGAWAVGNFTTTSAGTRLVSQTNGSTLNLTGFQVELGTVATVFEQRTHGIETVLCQRYFESSSTNVSTALWLGNTTSGTNYVARVKYAVVKRTAPSITLTVENQSGFPAAVGSFTGDALAFQETRQANATTSGGFFSTYWSANADF